MGSGRRSEAIAATRAKVRKFVLRIQQEAGGDIDKMVEMMLEQADKRDDISTADLMQELIDRRENGDEPENH